MTELLTVTELRRELDEALQTLRSHIIEDFQKEIGNLSSTPIVPKRVSGVHAPIGPKRRLSVGPRLAEEKNAAQKQTTLEAADNLHLPLSPRFLSHVSEVGSEGDQGDRSSMRPGNDAKQIPLMLSRDVQGKGGSSRDIEALAIDRTSRRSTPRQDQQYSILASVCCSGGAPSLAPGATLVPNGEAPSESCLGRLLEHPWFSSLIFFCIFLNSVLLGFETDYAARHSGEEYTEFAIAEIVFCCVFSIELALRICYYGGEMWRSKHCIWNSFDTLLVVGQIGEAIAAHIRMQLPQSERDMLRGDHITVLRILRILRVVRFGRLRVFQEPREMLASVIGSMRAFMWVVIMMFLLNYVVSIIVCQIACQGVAYREIPDFEEWFGGLGRTMLTMFESISGGLSWDSAVRPLLEISPVIGCVFCFYIAFCVLCIMNVVTGTFVQRATTEARQHEDNMTANLIRDVFMRNDDGVLDNRQEISEEVFLSKLNRHEMKEYFSYMGIDVSEGGLLFKLLDVDRSGAISADELVDGCLRVRGEAKALELSVLTSLTNEIRLQQDGICALIEDLCATHNIATPQADGRQSDSVSSTPRKSCILNRAYSDHSSRGFFHRTATLSLGDFE